MDTHIATPFRANGRQMDLWEADEWATERGGHVDELWPREVRIADQIIDRELTRLSKRRRQSHTSMGPEVRRHVLALMETGHVGHEVAALLGLSPDTVRRIDAGRLRRASKVA